MMDLEVHSFVLPASSQNGQIQFYISMLDANKNNSALQTFVFKVREEEIELFFGTKRDITPGIVYQTLNEALSSVDPEELRICIYNIIAGGFD